jgi:hypothetical protein
MWPAALWGLGDFCYRLLVERSVLAALFGGVVTFLISLVLFTVVIFLVRLLWAAGVRLFHWLEGDQVTQPPFGGG